MLPELKAMLPDPWRAIAKSLKSHWRQQRYGQKGIPINMCGEILRFKLGFEPSTYMPGKFWEDDRLLMKKFYEAIMPGGTVVDVGAFVGHYTMLAARKVGPNGKVLAFEPSPASCRVLMQHLVLNDLLDRVDIWPLATGRHNDYVKIYFQRDDPIRGHNSTSPTSFEQKGLTAGLDYRLVPRVALGPFMDSLAFRPDVIKIDVEGGEVEVLQSLEAVLQTPALIFCELHPQLWMEADRQFNDLQLLLDRTGRVAETLVGQPLILLQHEPVILKKK